MFFSTTQHANTTIPSGIYSTYIHTGIGLHCGEHERSHEHTRRFSSIFFIGLRSAHTQVKKFMNDEFIISAFHITQSNRPERRSIMLQTISVFHSTHRYILSSLTGALASGCFVLEHPVSKTFMDLFCFNESELCFVLLTTYYSARGSLRLQSYLCTISLHRGWEKH